MRIAVPDYNLEGKTGAKTSSPGVFPRQSYEIDGINGLFKTDMISQLNLNGKDVMVEISRGGLVTDKTGWKCSGILDDTVYREWNATSTIDGMQYQMTYALPDANASYFTWYEIMGFGTEFLHTAGTFDVYFWDVELQREGFAVWQPMTQWHVVRQDGPTIDSGVRLATYQGHPVIQISNVRPQAYFDFGQVFDTNGGPLSLGQISGRVTNAVTQAAIPFPTVAIYNSKGEYLTNCWGEDLGRYVPVVDLPAGTFLSGRSTFLDSWISSTTASLV